MKRTTDLNYIEPGTKCGYHSGKPSVSKGKDGINQYTYPVNCTHPAKHRIWNELFHGSNVYCDCHYLIVQIEGSEHYLAKIDEVKECLKENKKKLAETNCP